MFCDETVLCIHDGEREEWDAVRGYDRSLREKGGSSQKGKRKQVRAEI